MSGLSQGIFFRGKPTRRPNFVNFGGVGHVESTLGCWGLSLVMKKDACNLDGPAIRNTNQGDSREIDLQRNLLS